MVGLLLHKGAHTRHIETLHEPPYILFPQKKSLSTHFDMDVLALE